MFLEEKNKTPDLYGELYSDFRVTGTPFLAYRDLPEILSKYASGKDALDYGSGSGETSFFLKSLGYNVVGVDINDRMLTALRQRDPGGQYLKIDSAKIPSDNETYDLVVCAFVLLEIATKGEILKVVSEIRRVLKKGGIFISILTNDNTYKHDWLTLNTSFPENKNLTSGSKVKVEFRDLGFAIDDYYWTENDYKEIFQKAGFVISEIHKPIGREDDGYEWRDEKNFPPITIFVCKG